MAKKNKIKTANAKSIRRTILIRSATTACFKLSHAQKRKNGPKSKKIKLENNAKAAAKLPKPENQIFFCQPIYKSVMALQTKNIKTPSIEVAVIITTLGTNIKISSALLTSNSSKKYFHRK